MTSLPGTVLNEWKSGSVRTDMNYKYEYERKMRITTFLNLNLSL